MLGDAQLVPFHCSQSSADPRVLGGLDLGAGHGCGAVGLIGGGQDWADLTRAPYLTLACHLV